MDEYTKNLEMLNIQNLLVSIFSEILDIEEVIAGNKKPEELKAVLPVKREAAREISKLISSQIEGIDNIYSQKPQGTE